MHAITKVFSDIVKPYIDAADENLQNQLNINGAKNLLPKNTASQTISDVTITVNDDGSVTIEGTATANIYFPFTIFSVPTNTYIISSGETESSNNSYLYLRNRTDGIDMIQHITKNIVTLDNAKEYGVSVCVKSGTTVNRTFYPMLRLASVTDDTYEPYAKTNQQLTKDTTGLIDNDFANGAVNLFPNNATTQVINGVTFTVNDDGTITANGTSTAFITFSLGSRTFTAGKKYKLTGSPSGSSSNTYYLVYYNGTNYALDYGSGYIFRAQDNNAHGIDLVIRQNQTVSDLTFKPMITLADMPNSDYAHYVPYAMTNQELTSENQTLKNQANNLQRQIALLSNEYSSTTAYKIADYVIHDNMLYRCITNCSAASWETNKNCFVQDSIINNTLLKFRGNSMLPSDLNDAYSDGLVFYQVGNIGTHTNAPSNAGSTGLLVAIKTQEYTTQIFYGNLKMVYRFRYSVSGAWQSWINDN